MQLWKLSIAAATDSAQACFQDFPNPFLLQGFEYYVVIDFEATCDKERNLHPQGIIEFPSVVVSGVTGDIIACFQTYVRPTFDPLLTDFCKELTGIQQHQVDNGVTLGEALYFHDKWLLQKGLSNTNFSVVAWSDWDCQAVELVWHGRAHWGLDDSINMARFLAVIMQRGFKFSITKSLTPPQAITQDSPITSNRHHQFLVLQRMCTFQHTSRNPAEVEEFRCCFCGAKSFKKIIRKPGPKCGSFFFGCGNLTPNKGASCNYFHSATA
ncbi:hypothetical protein WN943_021850 [Citrus x changshan-huyou]